jgi:hypothetical protein
MSSTVHVVRAVTEVLHADIEAALNPVEAEGVYRDTSPCSVILLAHGRLLFSPPPPRPKKGRRSS